MMNNAAEGFNILTTSLTILHNYFDNLTKLFSDLYIYVAKFLDISIKLFFLKIYWYLKFIC